MYSHDGASEAELLRRSRAAAEQRPADGGWEHVVKIKMQLAEDTDAGSAGAIDRNHRLKTDLEIVPHPDHAWIDRSGRESAVAVIVGDRRCQLCLDDRNQVIDKLRQLVVADFRFQIGRAELNRGAIDQH